MLTHSDATATFRPLGSIAMDRAGTDPVAVTQASDVVEPIAYRRTSESLQLESQQSSYERTTG